MPDFWTHLIAGEEITAQITNESIRQLIYNNQELFNYGCQGPDFFFYYNFLPWQNNKKSFEIGKEIHNTAAKKLFTEILKRYKKEAIYELKEIPNSIYWQHNLVYLLAFISHFALDKECHPYIIENGGQADKHKLIEANLDLYIVKKRWDKNAADINPLPYYKLSNKNQATLKYFYQIISSTLTDNKIPKAIVWESYFDFRNYHRLFFAKTNRKFYLLKFLNYILSLNLSQYNYRLCQKEEVWDLKTKERFISEFEKGINLAVNLIEKTLKYFISEISLTELMTEFGSQNFLGKKS